MRSAQNGPGLHPKLPWGRCCSHRAVVLLDCPPQAICLGGGCGLDPTAMVRSVGRGTLPSSQREGQEPAGGPAPSMPARHRWAPATLKGGLASLHPLLLLEPSLEPAPCSPRGAGCCQ